MYIYIYDHVFNCLLDPACQDIDVQHRCYTLSRLCNTRNSSNENVINTEQTTGSLTHGLLGGLLVLTIIIFVLLFFLWKLKKQLRGMYILFLSSPKSIKWTILIEMCPISVVVVIVVVNFSHFHLHFQNHWTNFNQTWHKASLDEGDSSFLNKVPRSFRRGNTNVWNATAALW